MFLAIIFTILSIGMKANPKDGMPLFDYQMLMNQDSDFTIKRNPILDTYDYWQKHWKSIVNLDDVHIDQDDLWAFKQVREKLLKLGEKNYIIKL